MTGHAEIDAAVARLGQAMGMDLKLDENRACRLVFDEKLAVDIEAPDILESTLVMTNEPIHRHVRYLWTPGASLTGHGRRQRSHSCVSHVESILSDSARSLDL